MARKSALLDFFYFYFQFVALCVNYIKRNTIHPKMQSIWAQKL